MEKGVPANSAAPGGVVSVEALKATSTATAVAASPAPPAMKPKTSKTRTKEVSFQIAAGAAQKLLPSLQAGAGAAVLAFGSPAPTGCYEVYTAWKDGDETLAKLKQERLGAVAQRVGSELGVPGIKYAMDLNGYYGGPARLPLLPLTGAEKQEIEKLMADLRN
jgi:4-hydroxy-2-oxoglutarate aldolase